MLDLDRIVGFDWDHGNSRKSSDKHDVGQTESEQVFFNEPLVIQPDVRHSLAEPRLHALGGTNDRRLLQVTFTLRGDDSLIRVISARDMSRKERLVHDQST